MAKNRWYYTGSKLKSFLQRNCISYKDAATTLGIDKNTVGKAVRGGNLNIDILLRICNEYGLSMNDFFAYEVVNNTDYLNSLSNEGAEIAEGLEKYKKCELSNSEIAELKEILSKTASSLQDATLDYQRCYQLLEELLSEK